jgi:hypothetical protein
MAIVVYVTVPCMHALISAIRHVLVGVMPSFSVPNSATKSSKENVKNLRAELMGEVQDDAQEEQDVNEAQEEHEVREAQAAQDGVLTQGDDLGGGQDLAPGHDMPQET